MMDWIKTKKIRKSDGLEIAVVVRYVQINGAFFRYYQRDGYPISFYLDSDFLGDGVVDLNDDGAVVIGSNESLEYKVWSSCFKGPENRYYYSFLYENIRNMYKWRPKIPKKIESNEKGYIENLKEIISDYKVVISSENMYNLLEDECEKIIQEKFEEIK